MAAKLETPSNPLRIVRWVIAGVILSGGALIDCGDYGKDKEGRVSGTLATGNHESAESAI